MHDTVHNITCADVRYHKGVMVVVVKWSKTNQSAEEVDFSPMMANNRSLLCPVRWILHMIEVIPAKGFHNLFSFINESGQVLPITYRDLMKNLRNWLSLIGIKKTASFSSHSMRHGGTTAAFNAGINEQIIKKMGGWKSDCYKSYIEVDTKKQVKAWRHLTNHK